MRLHLDGFTAFFPPKAKCPVCELPTLRINAHDAGICPEHGEISGMDYLMGWSKLDALIELRCRQAKAEIRAHVEAAWWAINQNPPYTGPIA